MAQPRRHQGTILRYFFILLGILLPQAVLGMTPDQIFEQVKDSIVVVKVYDAKGKQIGQGSGVILPSGKIVTNYHVLEAGERYEVGSGNDFRAATWESGDEDKDLGLLKADSLKAKPADLGQASKLKVGEAVYAVGSPQGLELSLSDGIVSQLRGGAPPIIQMTAAISRGSSGGGLFSGEGKLVGITTFYMEGGQSLNFAVPVEWLKEIGPAKKEAAKKERGTIDWFAKTALLEEKKDWKGLLNHAKKWVQAEPKNSSAWYNLGIAYCQMDRYSDAIDAYREALKIKPDYAGAWHNLGYAYCQLGRYSDSIDPFREALKINPDDAMAWNNLGFTYDDMGRYSDAIDAYREALKIKPDYAKAWYNLGYAYSQTGRHPDAINAFREALRINPDDAGAWYNLGIAYYIVGRYSDAVDAYREALKINPDDAMAWGGLCLGYARSGNRRAALEVIEKLRRYDPDKADKLFEFVVPK